MVDIMPIENRAEAAQIADKAEEFGKEHFDGFGYTDLFVIPEPKQPLALRQIPLDFISFARPRRAWRKRPGLSLTSIQEKFCLKLLGILARSKALRLAMTTLARSMAIISKASYSIYT